MDIYMQDKETYPNIEMRSNKNSCVISKLIQALPYDWILCKWKTR